MKVQEEKREIAISDFTYNEMIHDKENLPKKKKLTNRLKINYKLLKVKTTTEGNVNDKREWGLQDLAKNLKNSLENGKNPIYLIILRFFRDYVDGGLENGRTSKEDIINGCDVRNPTSTYYTEWGKKHGQYKILVSVQKGEYRINPELLQLDILKQI